MNLIDIIYNFIKDVILGNSDIPGVDNMAILLTYTSLIFLFILLIKLFIWAFNLAKPKIRR